MMKRFCVLLLSIMLCVSVLGTTASAYIERGEIGISADAAELTLKKGENAMVNITLDPESETHLPGCGYDFCPQTCDKTCLTKDGSCTCGPTNYETYYTTVAAESSDPSVCTVTYADGVGTVTALKAGKATVTFTASLQEHTDTPVSVDITVINAGPSPLFVGLAAAAVIIIAVCAVILKRKKNEK